MKTILISDVKCHDCNGPVTLFGIPDKVWKALGLKKKWVCMDCVAKRINPKATAKQLNNEIQKRKKRFKLEQFNKVCGQLALRYGPNRFLFEFSAEELGVETMTAAQVMNKE
jgi:hypothetical protein